MSRINVVGKVVINSKSITNYRNRQICKSTTDQSQHYKKLRHSIAKLLSVYYCYLVY